jgi:hypothetical protein
MDRQMTEEEIKQTLVDMELNDMLITNPNYSGTLPEEIRLLSFQEWHLAYLVGHPKINALNYLTNLRVMIKVRP